MLLSRKLLDFGTNVSRQKEFIAWHAVENPAFGAVMRKCGFVYEKNEVEEWLELWSAWIWHNAV